MSFLCLLQIASEWGCDFDESVSVTEGSSKAEPSGSL